VIAATAEAQEPVSGRLRLRPLAFEKSSFYIQIIFNVFTKPQLLNPMLEVMMPPDLRRFGLPTGTKFIDEHHIMGFPIETGIPSPRQKPV